jgi:hypothetical protein
MPAIIGYGVPGTYQVIELPAHVLAGLGEPLAHSVIAQPMD